MPRINPRFETLNYSHDQITQISAVRDDLAQTAIFSSLLSLGDGS